jgi:hypothetical protein
VIGQGLHSRLAGLYTLQLRPVSSQQGCTADSMVNRLLLVQTRHVLWHHLHTLTLAQCRLLAALLVKVSPSAIAMSPDAAVGSASSRSDSLYCVTSSSSPSKVPTACRTRRVNLHVDSLCQGRWSRDPLPSVVALCSGDHMYLRGVQHRPLRPQDGDEQWSTCSRTSGSVSSANVMQKKVGSCEPGCVTSSMYVHSPTLSVAMSGRSHHRVSFISSAIMLAPVLGNVTPKATSEPFSNSFSTLPFTCESTDAELADGFRSSTAGKQERAVVAHFTGSAGCWAFEQVIHSPGAALPVVLAEEYL